MNFNDANDEVMNSVLDIDQLLPGNDLWSVELWVEALVKQQVTGDDAIVELDVEELQFLQGGCQETSEMLLEGWATGQVPEQLIEENVLEANATREEMMALNVILTGEARKIMFEVIRRNKMIEKVESEMSE